jgi:ParB/RepB/Spo0J family partition protein
MKSKVTDIKPTAVLVEERARTDKKITEEFVNNIKEHGIIQPIIITKEKRLLAGERRLLGALAAGLETIPAIIKPTEGPLAALQIELFENIYRADFEWHEQIELTEKIHAFYVGQDSNWRQLDTAKALGKSQPKIARELEIAEAMKKLPLLKKAGTEDGAVVMIKKLQEAVAVKKMKAEIKQPQLEPIPGEEPLPGEEPSYDDYYLNIANTNYSIGEAIVGMQDIIDHMTTPHGAINFLEVDPPYAIDLQKKKTKAQFDTTGLRSYNEIDPEQYPEFLVTVAKQTYTIAAEHAWMIWWFGHEWYQTVITILREAGWQVDSIPAVWVKGSGQTKQPEINLARTYEPFFVCRKGNPVMAKRGRANVFDFKPEAPSKKYHPTQRPLALINAVFEVFTFPNSLVLSPFLGSGATLRVCYYRGNAGFGWDLSSEYKDRFLLAVKEDRGLIKVAEEEEQEEEPTDVDDDILDGIFG